jgi:hypothetical protein
MVDREVPSAWRKSSFSQGGDCVEWCLTKSLVYVRTSKEPSGQVLRFTHSEWRAFISAVKSGEADFTAEEV